MNRAPGTDSTPQRVCIKCGILTFIDWHCSLLRSASMPLSPGVRLEPTSSEMYDTAQMQFCSSHMFTQFIADFSGLSIKAPPPALEGGVAVTHLTDGFRWFC